MKRKPPQYRGLVGKRIVAIEQDYYPSASCRPGAWHVHAIVLEDGTRFLTYVSEHEDTYSVQFEKGLPVLGTGGDQ